MKTEELSKQEMKMIISGLETIIDEYSGTSVYNIEKYQTLLEKLKGGIKC